MPRDFSISRYMVVGPHAKGPYARSDATDSVFLFKGRWMLEPFNILSYLWIEIATECWYLTLFASAANT